MEPKVLSATECQNESKKRFQTDLELLEAVKQIMANLCGLKFEKGGKKTSWLCCKNAQQMA